MPKNPEHTIHPTGRCFDDAMDFLEYLSLSGTDSSAMRARYRLVHGIYHGQTASGQQQRFSHAWVWDLALNTAIQCGFINGEELAYHITLDAFRENLRMEHETVYTVDQVAALNRQHNTYGPWEPAYLALCR